MLNTYESNLEKSLIFEKTIDICVLMATYNGGMYLREQIESVLSQENVNIILVVRDDGSTDNTCDILDEYKNKGVLTWFSNNHVNVPNSFFELISNAPQAPYYAFCDQDDVWDKDKLWVAIKKMKNFPEEKPALYYSSQRLVDKDLNLISNHTINIKRSNITNYFRTNIAGCTSVFNKTLLDTINLYTPKYAIMHDTWIFKVCVCLGGNVYKDKNAHISYRQHNNNVIGLNNNLKSKYLIMKKYIFNSKIQEQTKNLVEGYYSDMTDEYKMLTKLICEYDKSFINWIRLLFIRKIDFKNLGLNLMFRMKILLRKL